MISQPSKPVWLCFEIPVTQKGLVGQRGPLVALEGTPPWQRETLIIENSTPWQGRSWRLIIRGLAEKSVATHENDGFHPSLAPMNHILLLGVEHSYPLRWAWLKFEYLKCAKLGVISLFLDTTISHLSNISSPYCIQYNPIKRNTY